MNWQYISGFFDADGSISLIKQHANQQRTPQITFHNNERAILEEIQHFVFQDLGLKGYISQKAAAQVNHKTAYELKFVYFPGCTKLADKLQSRHNRKKNRLALLRQIRAVSPRNGKYFKEQMLKRKELEKQFFSL